MKEKIIEMVKNFNEEELVEFVNGINQITFEYGWGENLDNNEALQNLYYEN